MIKLTFQQINNQHSDLFLNNLTHKKFVIFSLYVGYVSSL